MCCLMNLIFKKLEIYNDRCLLLHFYTYYYCYFLFIEELWIRVSILLFIKYSLKRNKIIFNITFLISNWSTVNCNCNFLKIVLQNHMKKIFFNTGDQPLIYIRALWKNVWKDFAGNSLLFFPAFRQPITCLEYIFFSLWSNLPYTWPTECL